MSDNQKSPSKLLIDTQSEKRLQVPSPIITRRTRTESTSSKTSDPEFGKVKEFCRAKGHGFIVPSSGSEPIFVHVSDIEGEYVPLPGDEVQYRLCPIPPKYEKYQAVQVRIINLTPQVHLRWNCHLTEEEH